MSVIPRTADVATRRLSRGYLIGTALLPALALAVLALALQIRFDASPSGASVGHPAPEFAVTDLDGNPIRLSEMRGRPVIVNFWASWCVPCLEEFPRLRAAVAEHADADLAVIGIVFQDQWSSAQAYVEHMGATWPAAMDPGGRVARAYGVFGPPQTVFIGRDGVVRAQQFGPFDSQSLERHLAQILPDEPSR